MPSDPSPSHETSWLARALYGLALGMPILLLGHAQEARVANVAMPRPAFLAIGVALAAYGVAALPGLSRGLRWLYPTLAVPRFAVFAYGCFLLVYSFGALYFALYAASPNAFALPDSAASVRLLDFLYFSASTLFTAGFGDIVARTTPARLAVIAEMMAGFYLVGTVIAGYWRRDVPPTRRESMAQAFGSLAVFACILAVIVIVDPYTVFPDSGPHLAPKALSISTLVVNLVGMSALLSNATWLLEGRLGNRLGVPMPDQLWLVATFGFLVVCWGGVHWAVANLLPGSYGPLGPLRFFEFEYYAATALSSTGFGDIVPVSHVAKIATGAQFICTLWLLVAWQRVSSGEEK